MNVDRDKAKTRDKVGLLPPAQEVIDAALRECGLNCEAKAFQRMVAGWWRDWETTYLAGEEIDADSVKEALASRRGENECRVDNSRRLAISAGPEVSQALNRLGFLPDGLTIEFLFDEADKDGGSKLMSLGSSVTFDLEGNVDSIGGVGSTKLPGVLMSIKKATYSTNSVGGKETSYPVVLSFSFEAIAEILSHTP